MRGLLVAIILLLTPGLAVAHEGRPILIEIEQSDSQIKLNWQVPPVVPAAAEPQITISGCEATMQSPHGLRGFGIYICADQQQKAHIKINWPSINPALSTLVEIKDGQTRFFGPEQTKIPLGDFEQKRTDFASFVETGVEHILLGFDHLCFILILTLIVLRGQKSVPWGRLAWMVTGFTLAHSITLAAATLQLIRIPAPPVEAVIALSIIFVAAELARDNRQTITFRYPVLTASSFGLLHGFGFASVLADAGLPDEARLLALLGFNIGVELGQLGFVATILFIMFMTGRLVSPAVKPLVLQGATYTVGILATYWMTDRILQF